jgi:D-3-phosphoglycerate dehydrogenase
MTDKTAAISCRRGLAKTKKGVRIVNCARGGLVDEAALAELLKSGHVAGAGFDVFETEPATENPLFNLPNVVCTPHLGASTTEAQENVALQVAEQMSDYLLTGRGVERAQHAVDHRRGGADPGPWLKLADIWAPSWARSPTRRSRRSRSSITAWSSGHEPKALNCALRLRA